MFEKIKNITIIAPHPDDELMGCLTLFKLQKVNKLLIVTNGGIQTVKKTITNKEYIQKRKKESIRFAKYFGLKRSNVIFLNFKDGGLERKLLQHIIQKIKNYIGVRDILCIPSTVDCHQDHQIVSKACQNLNNKKIFYSVTNNLTKSKKIEILILEKQNLLRRFYPSQYRRLLKSDFPFRNYEQFKIDFKD